MRGNIMSERRLLRTLLLKRLGVFLALTFAFTWGVMGLGTMLFGDAEEEAVRVGLFSVLGMMGPALGHLLTRLLTREGWQGTYLELWGKSGKKWRVYHLAVWGQLVMLLAAVVLLCIYEGVPFRLQYSVSYSVGLLLVNTATGFAGLLIYFGEEWGWRGYLFPKLELLIGTAPALLGTGVIWGVWHLPSLLEGLNFGKDFPGYPVSNVLLMCVYCTLIGCFFSWMTWSSGSVWPAVLVHMLQDHAADAMTFLFLPEDVLQRSDGMGKIYCNFAVLVPMLALVLWDMCRKRHPASVSAR